MSTSKRIAKRLIAVVLTVMMLMSMVTIGMTSASAAYVDMAETGATVSSTGSSRLYFNMSAVSWWTAGTNGNGNFAYFFNNSTGKYAWSTHAVQYSDSTYYFTIPSGDWSGVILTRNNTSTSPSWDNKWNQTGDITLSSTSNYLSKFSEGSTSVTWGTAIKVASTAALTASANTVAVGEEVTLTSSLSSNANLNTIWSTTYSVDPATATVTDGVFTATEAGEYTVTANVTYYANSYTSISSSATATTAITVEAPATSSVAVDDTATGDESATEPETQPTTTEPAETNGTAMDASAWFNADGLYAYASVTDAPGADAWQRWDNVSGHSADRYIYLPASASDTEVIIYNNYSDTVELNGVKIDAGCYAIVPYVNGTTYTTSGATSQTVKIMKSDAEGTIFINSADGMTTKNDDGVKSTVDATYDLYSFLTSGTKNQEAGSAAGAVASANDGVIDYEVEEDGEMIGAASVKKIKGRGNSTWGLAKKPFNITFNKNIEIDGMKGKKWSLLANAQDPSLLRNRLVYDLANEVNMTYACDSRFVDWFVNGDYKGSYQLTQKIELGKNTVMPDLEEPEVEDITEDDGTITEYPKADFDFILELDTATNAANAGDLTFTTSRGQVMTHKVPDEPAAEQVEFMKAKYQAVEDALYTGDIATLETLVDLDDFARAYLVNEVAKNLDAGVTSCYFTYNSETGKFTTAPVWDYDNALGNSVSIADRHDANGNMLDVTGPSGWYARDLMHYDLDVLNVFGQACATTSTNAAGETFNDVVLRIWNDEFMPALAVLEGTATAANGRFNSVAGYMANLAESGQWNYDYAGWDLTANNGWVADHSSLTMYDYDAEANTYTTSTKSYDQYTLDGQANYAGDWMISRMNWMAAQYAEAELDVPDGYITIYFENNWKWPDAKVYYWGSTIGTNPEWNGISLTNVVGQNDAGYDIYEIVIPADITGLLFNGTGEYGAEQSADITSGWYEGICYYMTYDSATNTKPCGTYDYNVPEETTAPAETTTAPAETTTAPAETTTAATSDETTTAPAETTTAPAEEADTITIYFENNWKWPDAKIYYWGSTTHENPAWSGIALTNVVGQNDAGYDIYEIVIPADITGIIFNGTGEYGAEQSADITEGWYDGICYYMTYDSATNTKPCGSYDYKVPEETTTAPAESTPAATADETDPVETTTAPAETTTAPAETTTAPADEVGYVTVYFQNNWLWSDVSIYIWNSSITEANNTWPGVAMELYGNDGTYDVYSAVIPEDCEFIINGTKDDGSGATDQTPDLANPVDGTCYYMKWDNGNQVGSEDITVIIPPEETTTPVESTPAATADETDPVESTPAATTEETETSVPDMPTVITVYAINSANWAEIYAYCWADSPAVAWPGVAMDKTEETVNGFDVYALSFDSAYVNVIFNNNDNGSQTADLTAMDGQYYDIKGATWYESLEEVPAVDALSTDVYLVGSFNGWSTVANEFKLNAEGETTSYVTLTLEANTDYEFKIVRNGAWISCKDTLTITDTVAGLTFSSSISDNTVLTTKDAGEYVFAYNDSKLSVTYPGTTPATPDEEETDTTVKLAGDFTEWGTGAIEMTADENGTVYTAVVELAEGTYEFKIVEFGTWLGNNGTIENDACDGWTFRNGTDDNGVEYGNCTLLATGGTYTFTFDSETDKLTITSELIAKTYSATWDEYDTTYTLVTDADVNAIEEGTDFTFTVEVAEGYIVAGVIADMETLYADENGVYTIYGVENDINIIIITAEENTGDNDTPIVTPEKYTVMFVDYDNTILAVAKVEAGTNLPAPPSPTRTGYTFTGWSQTTDNVVKDMIVVAQYKKDASDTPVVTPTTGKLQVEVSGGTSFTINGRPQGTSYLNTKMDIGATVTVIASTTNGNEFIGWVNSNNLIVSADLEYSFTTTGNDYLKAMYKTDIAEATQVIFKNDKANQILDMQHYVAGDAITYPDAPNNARYKFVNWTFDGVNAITEADIQAKVAAGESVTVIPSWEKILVYVTVDVVNGTVSSNSGTNADGDYLKLGALTVVADAAIDNQKFAYWVDQNNNIKSYSSTYKFYPASDMTLTAVYVDADEAIEYEILMDINMDTSSDDKDVNTVILSWDVPTESGYTFKQAGALLVNEEKYNAETFIKGTSDSNVTKWTPGTANQKATNVVTVNKKGVNPGETWVLQAWVTYTYNGEDVTVYSDLVYVEK